MLTFLLTIWSIVIGFFGIQTDILTSSYETPPSITTEVPSGKPKQSAPLASLEACKEKQNEQRCSFILNNKSLEGICLPSGDALACTPVLPQEKK